MHKVKSTRIFPTKKEKKYFKGGLGGGLEVFPTIGTPILGGGLIGGGGGGYRGGYGRPELIGPLPINSFNYHLHYDRLNGETDTFVSHLKRNNIN